MSAGRREWPNLERFGARAPARHRYPSTSLHSQERCGNQCSVEIRVTCGLSSSADLLGEAGPSPGGLPIKAWPWPTPVAALEQPGFRDAQIALRSEEEMDVHGDVQEPPGRRPSFGLLASTRRPPGTATRLPLAMPPDHDPVRDDDADSFEEGQEESAAALETEADVTCPHCGEAMTITLDPGGGRTQIGRAHV